MATAKRMTYFKTQIEDKPGALLALTIALEENNLGLVGLKGVAQGRHGDVLVVPKNPEKLRTAWKTNGALIEEGTLFFLSGTDSTGALVSSLEALTKAGVNIVAVEAGAVGTRFGAFLWVAPGDVEKAAQVLGSE
jgi:hypothetical protein